MTPAKKHFLRSKLHKAQKGKCCYCEIEMVMPRGVAWRPGEDNHRYAATIEHLRRKIDGGSDGLDNLALACRRCNTSRGVLSWVEFKSMKSSQVAA